MPIIRAVAAAALSKSRGPRKPGINIVLDGADRVQKALQKASDAIHKRVAVQVGYTQKYALIVHQDLEAHHPVGKAKYLEDPARKLEKELTAIVRKAYQRTGDLKKSLVLAGLRLQRESQLEVPVDTSALKASAYTAADDEAVNVAREAFQRSERIRINTSSRHR